MPNEYMTLEELKHARELTGKTFADHDIQRELASASRAVDRICDRRFWLDTQETTRYFTASSTGITCIDDLAVPAASAAVVVDGDTWTLDTEYVFEPLNAAADGLPYEQVSAIDGNSFPLGKAKIAVTGTFGWPDVPEQIRTATGLLATILLLRIREAPLGVVFGAEVASRIATDDPQVLMLLDPFMKDVYVV